MRLTKIVYYSDWLSPIFRPYRQIVECEGNTCNYTVQRIKEMTFDEALEDTMFWCRDILEELADK